MSEIHPYPQQELQAQAEHGLATPDVINALATIDETQTHIANELGLSPDAPNLTELTDDALVHVAERATIEAHEAAVDAVIVALTAGALESTGQRPATAENPIIRLEEDGYGTAVTEAVATLHANQASLPDGTNASEAIAGTIEHNQLVLGERMAEITTRSHDPEYKRLASERNSHITAEDIWQPNTLHHVTSIKKLGNILKDGQLSEFVDPDWNIIRNAGPLNFGRPIKELSPNASRQDRMDNLYYSRHGSPQVYIHYTRPEGCYREGEEYVADERIMLMDGGMPSTEISALSIRDPQDSELKLGQIRDEIVSEGFYVPVFSAEGDLLYSKAAFDADIQAVQEGVYVGENTRRQQELEQKNAQELVREQQRQQERAGKPIVRPPM